MIKKFENYLLESSYFNSSFSNEESFWVRVDSGEDFDRLMLILESLNYKWLSGIRPTEHSYLHQYQWVLINQIDKTIGRGDREGRHQTNSTTKVVMLKDILKNDKEHFQKIDDLKNKMRDVDPYGEENWMSESLNFKEKFYVETENIEEYNVILKILDEEGYTWLGGGEKPMGYSGYNAGYRWLLIIPGMKRIGHNNCHSYLYKNIPATEFLFGILGDDYKEKYDEYREKYEAKLRLKKEKQIKMRDVDPFDEEDWID